MIVEREKQRQSQYIRHMKLMLEKQQLEDDLRLLERYFIGLILGSMRSWKGPS